jgi:hypothetical protein
MDIEVEVVSSSFAVSLDSSHTIEVSTDVSATRFGDLVDFNDDAKNDKYVIMYNSATNTYELVNPDKVLSAAASTETIQPGLPADFENVLDVDLDNRIDLDAGTF